MDGQLSPDEKVSARERNDVCGGSLPVDALNPQTISELQMIASRKGQTIEQVMSEALDWFLAVPKRNSRPTRK